MFGQRKNAFVRTMPLLAAFGAVAAAGQVMAHTTERLSKEAHGPLRCEILATKSGGGTALEGLVHADRAMSGSYMFRVTGGGSGGTTNIRQAGDFAVGAGDSAELGNVMLGGSGGVYDVRLEAEAGRTKVICTERIASSI